MEAYNDWTRQLIEKDWPIFFGYHPDDLWEPVRMDKGVIEKLPQISRQDQEELEKRHEERLLHNISRKVRALEPIQKDSIDIPTSLEQVIRVGLSTVSYIFIINVMKLLTCVSTTMKDSWCRQRLFCEPRHPEIRLSRILFRRPND